MGLKLSPCDSVARLHFMEKTKGTFTDNTIQ